MITLLETNRNIPLTAFTQRNRSFPRPALMTSQCCGWKPGLDELGNHILVECKNDATRRVTLKDNDDCWDTKLCGQCAQVLRREECHGGYEIVDDKPIGEE